MLTAETTRKACLNPTSISQRTGCEGMSYLHVLHSDRKNCKSGEHWHGKSVWFKNRRAKFRKKQRGSRHKSQEEQETPCLLFETEACDIGTSEEIDVGRDNDSIYSQGNETNVCNNEEDEGTTVEKPNVPADPGTDGESDKTNIKDVASPDLSHTYYTPEARSFPQGSLTSFNSGDSSCVSYPATIMAKDVTQPLQLVSKQAFPKSSSSKIAQPISDFLENTNASSMPQLSRQLHLLSSQYGTLSDIPLSSTPAPPVFPISMLARSCYPSLLPGLTSSLPSTGTWPYFSPPSLQDLLRRPDMTMTSSVQRDLNLQAQDVCKNIMMSSSIENLRHRAREHAASVGVLGPVSRK